MIYTGDALTVLRTLPKRSVQCCVTSPPYWGLRDYGTAKWNGGDSDCDHKPQRKWRDARQRGHLDGGYATVNIGTVAKGDCQRCGATRVDQQLGLERTPEEYVAKIVEVFREVRRVLRDDGTLWVVIGDSYASNWPCSRRNVIGSPSLANGKREARPPRMPAGLKQKDLVGIPWRVAFALQADGWYLRSEIIWHKPNPMPESVTDRPTKAHEQIFLLAKSQKYYYDAGAVAEPAVDVAHRTKGRIRKKADRLFLADTIGGNNRSGLHHQKGGRLTRNRRSVWTVTTAPYKGAHFATFPPKLIEPCILAGAPAGGTVLDPFSGAGTTVMTAEQLGRVGIGIELNPAYVKLTRDRMACAA